MPVIYPHSMPCFIPFADEFPIISHCNFFPNHNHQIVPKCFHQKLVCSLGCPKSMKLHENSSTSPMLDGKIHPNTQVLTDFQPQPVPQGPVVPSDAEKLGRLQLPTDRARRRRREHYERCGPRWKLENPHF